MSQASGEPHVTIEMPRQTQVAPPSPEIKEERRSLSANDPSTSNANDPSTSNANESADPNPLSQQRAQRPEIAVLTKVDLITDLEDVPLTPNVADNQRTNLPCEYLFNGDKDDYFAFGLPLYDASIKCDWEAAQGVLRDWKTAKQNVVDKPELLRCSITENGETALHIAASAKGPEKVGYFVDELVKKMLEKTPGEDLAIVNKNGKTALYLAAAAGNLETVKIMVQENRALLKIPSGDAEEMMPLYAAALFGNDKVVQYLYDNSNKLRDDSWTDTKRGRLLEKCVESDMFDIALKIVKEFPWVGDKSFILGVLARKHEAFREKECHCIRRKLNSVSSFFHLKVGVPEKENYALQLLIIVWGEIMKLGNKEIDDILRGSPDSSDSGRVIHTIRLENLLDKFQEETKIEVIKIELTKGQKEFEKLRNLVSKYVLDMHDEIQALIKENQTASGKGDFLELQKLISQYIVKIRDETESCLIYPPQLLANKLQKLIDHIEKVREEIKKRKHSSRVLFVAAEAGNTNFLVELIRLRPDLVRKVDDNNQTIFHIAVKHRHQGIYNLLCEIGSMKDMITPMKDGQNNNMLHLVGMIAKPKRLEKVSGPALQVQQELLWFQKVQDTIPPSCKDQKNQDDLTPHELFTKEHEDLVTQGEKWMKGAANQGMVVATVIATIVFAAAFTVPGGYAQNDEKKTNHKIGIPVFYSNTSFMVFIMADAISLFASSTSIFIFLSIRTSRYAECDFMESIPNKLMAGLATLFIAIATMTLTFGASFFVLYKKGLLWIPIFIGVFGFLPVILYMCLQFRMFSDIIRSIYVSKNLFKPKKHVLNYGKPKV